MLKLLPFTFLFFTISLFGQTVTVNSPGCLAGEEDFGFNGMDANGYNTYHNGFINADIFFDMANNKWVLHYSSGDLYENTITTQPKPPSTALNPWVAVGLCTGLEAIFTGDGTTNSLPVELTRFKAANFEKGVMLNWDTESEIENEGFEIEYSKDGGSWEILDFVAGQGDYRGTFEYEYFHESPAPGMAFYRLVQINYSGSEIRSEIINTEVKSNTNGWSVYPNPVVDGIYVSTEKGNALEFVNIYNSFGQLVKTEKGGIYKIDLQDLSPGVYFIKTEMEGVLFEEKILKL